MNTYKVLQGNSEDVLDTLPEKSVHCVVTSPPYFQARDYKTGRWEGGDPACDHKVGRFISPVSEKQRSNKGSGDMQAASQCPKCGAIRIDEQIGLEQTPDEYIQRLVAVFRGVRRVLRDDGTLWINIGDSFSNKQLLGIPWMLAFALQSDGWYLRSEIIWAKGVSGQDALKKRVYKAAIGNGVGEEKARAIANAVDQYNGSSMPESVTDRPSKSHEQLFLFAKSPRYYYDATAIADESADPVASANRYKTAFFVGQKHISGGYSADGAKHTAGMKEFNGTRNRRSVWTINPEPTKQAHFATMSTALIEPCILAGTSQRGCCPRCEAPYVRVVEKEGETPRDRLNERGAASYANGQPKTAQGLDYAGGHGNNTRQITTTGWQPSCECFGHYEEVQPEKELDEDGEETFVSKTAKTRRVYVFDGIAPEPVPCTVLDPFAGSGTTLRVAIGLGRDAIGIELNPEYVEMANKLTGNTQPALFSL